MEVEALTITAAETEHGIGQAEAKEAAQIAHSDAVAKAKDAKPAVERKRSRSLSDDKRFKLISGTANRPLAEEVAAYLGVKVGEAKLQRFADGEVYFQLLENVRGIDVFVVQIGRAHV